MSCNFSIDPSFMLSSLAGYLPVLEISESHDFATSFKTKSGIIQAVRNISFSINSGDTLGIVGESGCGKSITNLAIMRLLTPQAIVQADVLEFNGINLLNLKERKWQQIEKGHRSLLQLTFIIRKGHTYAKERS